MFRRQTHGVGARPWIWLWFLVVVAGHAAIFAMLLTGLIRTFHEGPLG